MRGLTPKIAPMKPRHVKACEGIVAASEPWKTLHERVPFRRCLGREPDLLACVCTIGAEVAGFAIFSPLPAFARGGYLRALGVSPRHRGIGVGRRLLTFAEDRTARKARYLFLCASSFNRPAQAFYKANGYARAGTLPGLIMPGASEHIYWKRLAPAFRAAERKPRHD
jgi:ribosomal protein S18 acetylase RimI-like enzyme